MKYNIENIVNGTLKEFYTQDGLYDLKTEEQNIVKALTEYFNEQTSISSTKELIDEKAKNIYVKLYDFIEFFHDDELEINELKFLSSNAGVILFKEYCNEPKKVAAFMETMLNELEEISLNHNVISFLTKHGESAYRLYSQPEPINLNKLHESLLLTKFNYNNYLAGKEVAFDEEIGKLLHSHPNLSHEQITAITSLNAKKLLNDPNSIIKTEDLIEFDADKIKAITSEKASKLFIKNEKDPVTEEFQKQTTIKGLGLMDAKDLTKVLNSNNPMRTLKDVRLEKYITKVGKKFDVKADKHTQIQR